MLAEPYQEKHALAAQFDHLNGQQRVVPSLKTIHPGWVLEKHPEYERLGRDLAAWCNSWWDDPRIRYMLESLDPALWTALSYPRTPYDKLLVIGKCLAWTFVWDDAIDDGKFTHDIEGVLRYQDETLGFINDCFEPGIQTLSLTHPDPAIEAFKDFAYEIKETSNPLTTSRFAEEFRIWVISTAECQKERVQPDVPALTSYLTRRSLNVGFYPYIVLLEYAYDVSIPDKWWKTNKDMQIIWYQSALIAFMEFCGSTNDMVSLPKELVAGQFESWIPLTMYHRGVSVQDAMDSTGQMVRDTSVKILDAENRLYADANAEILLATVP
ncbi:hypothetical protein M430DRAFT_271666 [Amorphotheca resinae ATCC 22711]|uniref:Terpene synthase n=1 Tax=Amorphotheca resinae ATCC 22711 TaxID=857342 RepID=A0A2T3AQD0_AMORE|nr:hypothetical protein M430DRAFT_271666 [Amorphotheca resinae ATCC 22711]PSS07198.1 hypothetical protein M430DRAFT_271666 [Amorphotheca resinae ATCC 22711]